MADKRTLTVSMRAEVAHLRKGINESVGLMKSLQKSSTATANVLKTAFAAGATMFAFNQIQNGIRNTISAFNETRGMIEDTKHLADSIGATTEEIQAIRRAAEEAEIPIDTLHKNIRVMTRSIGLASMGTGPAVAALATMGLSASELINLPLTEQLDMIAKSMSGIRTQSQKAAIAQSIFGKTGLDMLPFLMEAAPKIKELYTEMQETGELFTSEEAAIVDNMGDTLSRTLNIVQALKNQFVIGIAPIVENIARYFRDWFVQLGGARQAMSVIFEKGINFISKFLSISQKITVWAVKAGGAFVSMFGDIFSGDFTRVKNLFTTIVSTFKIGLLEALAAFSRGIQNLIDSMFDETTSLGAVLKDIMDTLTGRPAFVQGGPTNIVGPTELALAKAREELALASSGFVGGSIGDSLAKDLSKGDWGLMFKDKISQWTESSIENASIGKELIDDVYDIIPPLEKEKAIRDDINNTMKDTADLAKEIKDYGEGTSYRTGEYSPRVGGVSGGVMGGAMADGIGMSASAVAATTQGNTRTGADQNTTLLQGILEATRMTATNTMRAPVAVLG